jgi:hypothetical protein
MSLKRAPPLTPSLSASYGSERVFSTKACVKLVLLDLTPGS